MNVIVPIPPGASLPARAPDLTRAAELARKGRGHAAGPTEAISEFSRRGAVAEESTHCRPSRLKQHWRLQREADLAHVGSPLRG
jgi:hypothetical protein